MHSRTILFAWPTADLRASHKAEVLESRLAPPQRNIERAEQETKISEGGGCKIHKYLTGATEESCKL